MSRGPAESARRSGMRENGACAAGMAAFGARGVRASLCRMRRPQRPYDSCEPRRAAPRRADGRAPHA
ncbi:hypothetical protein WG70_17285 [Burkholderia oklahomensis EO147]|nr:hypothetical protein WG70_17285 [Burkholderia oklahomensis EO147]KUY63942.1 hypothetical protein WG70_30955 [Burkholderia oklahomensis EO147]